MPNIDPVTRDVKHLPTSTMNLDGRDRSCHILTKGAIISAVEGDKEAAVLAKRMAAALIIDHRGAAPVSDSSRTSSRS